MTLFTIDTEKCKKDGICADECPIQLIRFPDKDSFPEPVANAEAACINCGHCVAVCPHGALSLKQMASEACRPIRKELVPSREAAEQLLLSRRSIRTYKDKPVPRDLLSELIRVASYAPTGHNAQQVQWLVVYDRKEVKKMTDSIADWMQQTLKDQPDFAKMLHFDVMASAYDLGTDMILRGAPHLIISHAPETDPMSAISCSTAVAYLELAAASLGLGTCWAGFLFGAAVMWPPLRETLALPNGNACYGAVMVGYPKYKYHRIPFRNVPRIIWRG